MKKLAISFMAVGVFSGIPFSWAEDLPDFQLWGFSRNAGITIAYDPKGHKNKPEHEGKPTLIVIDVSGPEVGFYKLIWEEHHEAGPEKNQGERSQLIHMAVSRRQPFEGNWVVIKSPNDRQKKIEATMDLLKTAPEAKDFVFIDGRQVNVLIAQVLLFILDGQNVQIPKGALEEAKSALKKIMDNLAPLVGLGVEPKGKHRGLWGLVKSEDPKEAEQSPEFEMVQKKRRVTENSTRRESAPLLPEGLRSGKKRF